MFGDDLREEIDNAERIFYLIECFVRENSRAFYLSEKKFQGKFKGET